MNIRKIGLFYIRRNKRKTGLEEVFWYLEIYRNSLSDDDEMKDAEELIRYYENNREGFLPYQSQGLELLEPPEGLEYRNMGTMENHVWSVIAKRMKHGYRSWSRRGGKPSGKDSGEEMQWETV